MDVLFASANCRKEYIDVEREHKILQTVLGANNHTLNALPAVELPDLQTALSQNKKTPSLNILHFCGHASEKYGLHLRGPGQRTAYLDGATLMQWLTGAGVDLVVLNACDSETLAALLAEVVPAVVGTTRKVRDVAARQFTRDFYGGLTELMPVATAFEQALRKQRPSSTPAYVLIENNDGNHARQLRTGAAR